MYIEDLTPMLVFGVGTAFGTGVLVTGVVALLIP